jgi:1-acyl-sn-glycerol-3-phosphate acyltransferase
LLSKAFFGRSPWPTRFLAGVSHVFGARVRLEGATLRPHTLLVVNHLSWFDIVVLGGATGCTFVAKDELGHPFIHWLADQNHTVYVKRTHRKGAKDQALATAAALEQDQPVALFAEGTTGPGTYLLKDVAIRPVALDYGEAATVVSWFEEPAMHNVWRLLSRPGTIPVTVHVLESLDRALDRKQLAQAARDAIGRTLDLTLSGHSPIGEGE